jgi:hypothetical protein
MSTSSRGSKDEARLAERKVPGVAGDPGAEDFGGKEARAAIEKKLLWKTDLR